MLNEKMNLELNKINNENEKMNLELNKINNENEKMNLDLNKINNDLEILNNITERVFENKLIKQIIDKTNKRVLIDENNATFNGNICKILYLLKEKEISATNLNKSGNKMKYIIGGTVLYLFPCISVMGYASYIGYKGLNKLGKLKKENNKNRRNFKIFIDIYTTLGLEDKMNDMDYMPSDEELCTLKEQYTMRTNGDNLIEMLENIYK